MITRIFHAPGEWLSSRLSAQQRRDTAAWLLILIVATLPLRYLFKDTIWMIWALSEAAFIVSLATVVAAETPVESEDEID